MTANREQDTWRGQGPRSDATCQAWACGGAPQKLCSLHRARACAGARFARWPLLLWGSLVSHCAGVASPNTKELRSTGPITHASHHSRCRCGGWGSPPPAPRTTDHAHFVSLICALKHPPPPSLGCGCIYAPKRMCATYLGPPGRSKDNSRLESTLARGSEGGRLLNGRGPPRPSHSMNLTLPSLSSLPM